MCKWGKNVIYLYICHWEHCFQSTELQDPGRTLLNIPSLASESSARPQNATSVNCCFISSTMAILSLSGVLWKKLSFQTDFFWTPKKRSNTHHNYNPAMSPSFLLFVTLPFQSTSSDEVLQSVLNFPGRKKKMFLSRKVCLLEQTRSSLHDSSECLALCQPSMRVATKFKLGKMSQDFRLGTEFSGLGVNRKCTSSCFRAAFG